MHLKALQWDAAPQAAAQPQPHTLALDPQWPEVVNHTDVFVRCFGKELGRHPQLRDVFSRSPDIGNALMGQYQSRLHKAAGQGLTQVVQNILDCLRGTDQPEAVAGPLVAAAENGHTEIVNQLLGKSLWGQPLLGQSRHRHHQVAIASAFESAALRGHQPVVDALLKNTDIQKDSAAVAVALRQAAGGGHVPVVATLLRNTKLKDNPVAIAAALKEAAQYGRTGVVAELLNSGNIARNPEVVNDALTTAASYGHKSVVHMLRPHSQQPGLEDLLEQIYISRRSTRYSQ